jgi:hypothetical protein
MTKLMIETFDNNNRPGADCSRITKQGTATRSRGDQPRNTKTIWTETGIPALGEPEIRVEIRVTTIAGHDG